MTAKTKIAKKILTDIEEYLKEKLKLDSLVNLSQTKEDMTKLVVSEKASDNGYMTLLSEGSILYPDNSIRLYIVKGALKKWYESLTDDFEGYVTTGHVDLNSFPVREGYFRKEHLRLVTDEQGRSDLLVKPVVNTKLSNIQDIILQDEPFAISSEFVYEQLKVSEDTKEAFDKLLKHEASLGNSVDSIPIASSVDIKGFSFVGNPGNAKSGGYEPSILLRNEKEQLMKENILDSLLEKLSATEPEVTEEELKEHVSDGVPVPEGTEEEHVEPKETTEDKSSELLDKATEAIERLEKENAELKEKLEELSSYREKKQAEEQLTQEKLGKLEKLLTKASIVQPEIEQKEERPNMFGRKRHGGLN